MSSSSSSSSGGIGFAGLLTVVFVTLKLMGSISWSWWWVLAPLWLPTVIVLFIFFVFPLIIVGVLALIVFLSECKK